MGVGASRARWCGWPRCAVYDVRERRLPNWLTLPGAAAVLAFAAWRARAAGAARARSR